jgi:bis(5'-nucleosidyl)-tetraphosphatase
VRAKLQTECGCRSPPSSGAPEHHEFRWLPYEQARSLLGERLQPILDWADATVRGGAGPA